MPKSQDENKQDILSDQGRKGAEDISPPQQERDETLDFASLLQRYTYSRRKSKPKDSSPRHGSQQQRSSGASTGCTHDVQSSKVLSPSSTPASELKERGHLLPTTNSTSSRRAEKRLRDPYCPVNNFVDALRPGLHLVFVGLNPGLTTAETGHAYSHPSNLFWKLLHTSKITAYRHPPSDTHALMDLYSIGNTNLCVRPTRDGAGLSRQELENGVPVLEDKIRAVRPEVVCIVGKGVWDTITRVKKFGGGGKKPPEQQREEFRYGWQPEEMWLGRGDVVGATEIEAEGEVKTWRGSRTFVATTTSGLAAGMKPSEKEAIWKELGDWIVMQRQGQQAHART